MDARLWASAAILAVVMVLVLWRPRGLSIAWPALGGAALCLVAGLASARELWRVLGMTWNAMLALVGLMLLSATLDSNGAFRAAAHAVARHAGASGRRLFVGLCLLTAGATALLANDGAVLVLTPLTAELAALLGFSAEASLAYLFAVGFLCDATSSVLPASNLTNILMLDALGFDAGRFVAELALPSLAALVAAIAALGLVLGRALPRQFAASALGAPPRFDRGSGRASGSAIGLLVAGYGVAARARVPIGVVVAAVAVTLALVEHRRGAVDARRLARALPLDVVGFAVGLFLVVATVANHGAGAALGRLLDPAAAQGAALRHTFAVGAGVTLVASAANNLPALLVSTLALQHAGAAHTSAPLAALLGANIGCKLTPIGSLCTLLWLGLLERRGLRLGWARYLALAALPTLATLAAALAALALEQPLLH